jgi:hypothetical protein
LLLALRLLALLIPGLFDAQIDAHIDELFDMLVAQLPA